MQESWRLLATHTAWNLEPVFENENVDLPMDSLVAPTSPSILDLSGPRNGSESSSMPDSPQSRQQIPSPISSDPPMAQMLPQSEEGACLYPTTKV